MNPKDDTSEHRSASALSEEVSPEAGLLYILALVQEAARRPSVTLKLATLIGDIERLVEPSMRTMLMKRAQEMVSAPEWIADEIFMPFAEWRERANNPPKDTHHD